MKTPILFSLALFLSFGLLAQETFRETETNPLTDKATAVPTTIDFQGRLHESGGSPVNATLSITFSLYDVLVGGTALWTEIKTVQVTDGLFQVKLGEVTPFTPTHFSGTDRWLGIKVGSEAEMSPRTKISSVGYALQALETDPTWNGNADATGPVGRMGKVGIGINTPEFDLHVVGAPSTHNYGVIMVEGIKESNYTGAEFFARVNGIFGSSFGSDSNEDYIYGWRNDKPLKIYTSQTERMRISAGGNVGIGINSPTALLHTFGSGNGQGNVVFVGEKKDPPGPPPVSGPGTRLMWYPDKAAFRAGFVESSHWDQGNIGDYSTAVGRSTMASGSYSTAMGWTASALGDVSTAMGYFTHASGYNSTAMGASTIAWGQNSTAMGHGANAVGVTSTAMGYYTRASGDNSTAMGYGTIASSYIATAIGRFNISGGNSTGWVETDPIFEIGIGANNEARNNAMTVLKNGKVGIGTHTPNALLHAVGTGTGQGNVVFAGQYKSPPGPPPVTGEGTRMMWYPDKAAFRAGYVNGNQWDEGNVGYHSIALGGYTMASGIFSTAMGMGTNASGEYSTAMGNQTVASGSLSTAMGFASWASGESSTAMGVSTIASGSRSTALGNGANASGINSTAMGYYTTAVGSNSIAMGIGTIASSYSVTSIGRYNIGGGSATNWFETDPLFEIGIGSSSSARNNAMTVLKNGNVGIGSFNPIEKLHVEGNGKIGNHFLGGDYLEVSNYGAGNRYSVIDLHGDDYYTDFAFRIIRLNTGQNADSRIQHRGTGMLQLFTQEAAAIGFYTGSAERMRLNANGNFGIGTTNPGYRLQVGNAGDGSQARANAWNLLSDARLKRDFEHLENPFGILQHINGYYFFWNTGIDQSRQIGFSAQEVREVLPEVISEGEDGYLSIEYGKIAPLLLEAIKELKAENDRLKQENLQVNARLERLEKALESLSEK